jgi:hypothetical protein
MRILICDDNPRNADDIEAAVREGAGRVAITKLTSNELLGAVTNLFEHIRTRLEGKKGGATADFDGFDLVLIDNNLSLLATTGARLTAESIAGYLRVFSSASYIVSLNKNPDVDFDLRYLVGDYATRADLAINTEHLESKGLWSSKLTDDEFRPWYWPNLPDATERRKRQIDFVGAHLSKPILRSFGFTGDVIGTLSRHAVGALNPEATKGESSDAATISADELTFRQLFESSPRTLALDDERTALLNGKNRTRVARAIAGELDLWFRRDVSGPQNVLVDVPHLISRMPFLLGEEGARNIDAWNAAATATAEPFGLDKALYGKVLKKHRFVLDDWVARPSFWWSDIEQNAELQRRQFDLKNVGDFVFCEDISRFVPRGGPVRQRAREFVTEFEGPWHRRYVRRLKRVKYAPQSRFAL